MSNAPCLHKQAGKQCYKSVVKGTGYCVEHQQPKAYWSSYKPPKDWEKKKAQVIQRDRGICYLCNEPGADSVDHVKPKSKDGTDSLFNLKAVHDRVEPHCHREKTQREAQEAQRLAYKKVKRGSRLNHMKTIGDK